MKLKKLSPKWPEYPGNYRNDEMVWPPPAAAIEHRGPKSGLCAVCGQEIGSYESRYYGESGAAHIWKPGRTMPGLAECVNQTNRRLYPYYYTDG